jgi:ORF6N domain-containing protein
MFELNKNEYDSLRCQSGTLKQGQHSKYLPFVFAEQGIAMLSSVLNSKRAILVNVTIMRAFVQMREMLLNNAKMAAKLREIEDRVDTQEMNTILLMDKLRDVDKKLKGNTNPGNKPKIGFHIKK